MSAPPPPPPRRARGPVDPTAPAPQRPPAAPSPAPPSRRAAPPADPLGPSTATVGATAVTPSGPTRAERRAAEQAGRRKKTKSKKASNGDGQGSGRKGLVIGIAVVLVLALAAGGAFAAGVFSSDGDGGGGSDELEASTNVNLEAGEVKVRWPGIGPGESDPELPNQVMTVLGQYVDNGIVPALRTGTVNLAELQDTFDLGAYAQLEGDARGTLFDEGQPKAIGKLTITAPPVEIIALNDAGNATVLATAKLDLNLRVQSAQGYYTIRHDGEIVLVPDGGTWKITGWDVQAERSTPTARPPWITTTTAAEKPR